MYLEVLTAPCTTTVYSGVAYRALPFVHFVVFWLLQDLYVRPSFRGKGIGQRLVTLAAMAAQRGGCARVTWQVLDW